MKCHLEREAQDYQLVALIEDAFEIEPRFSSAIVCKLLQQLYRGRIALGLGCGEDLGIFKVGAIEKRKWVHVVGA